MTFVTIFSEDYFQVHNKMWFWVFAENVRKSGRVSKIFIFWPTDMCNTSKKSSEKLSLNFEIIFEVFLLWKGKKNIFSFFNTKNFLVYVFKYFLLLDLLFLPAMNAFGFTTALCTILPICVCTWCRTICIMTFRYIQK